MTEDQLREVAERALAHAQGEIQVTVAWERGLIATAGGTRADDAVKVEVVAVDAGAIGESSTSNTDDEALARVVGSAERVAVGAIRATDARLPDPSPSPADAGAFDPAVAGIDPADVPLPEHTFWEGGVAHVLVRSTRGVDAFERRSYVRGTYDWRNETRGVRLTTAAPGGRLDLEALAALGRELGGETASGRAQAGETAVVLGPEAVADLLNWLRWTFSPHGRLTLGERVGSDAVTLSDDAAHTATLPRSYDVEGVPRQAVSLVERGIARNVVWDTVSAAQAAGEERSTGHAGQPGRGLPFPHHLVLAGGDAADEAELMAPVDTGLYLAGLPELEGGEDGVISAIGAGAFAIRGGERAEPLEDPAVEVGLLEVLANVEALTSAQRLVPTYGGARHVGASVVPALRASGGVRVRKFS